MDKINKINANNLAIARVGGLCESHDYNATEDPDILKCSECGSQTLTTEAIINNLGEKE